MWKMSSFSALGPSVNSMVLESAVTLEQVWILLWLKKKESLWAYAIKLVRCCKLSSYPNKSCDEHVVYFQQWLKWCAIFITFLLSGNYVISLKWRPLHWFVSIYTHVLSQFRNKLFTLIYKVNILKNNQPSIKWNMKDFYWRNPVSCRINRLLICYLISKQASLNAFKSILVRGHSQPINSFCLKDQRQTWGRVEADGQGKLYICMHLSYYNSILFSQL